MGLGFWGSGSVWGFRGPIAASRDAPKALGKEFVAFLGGFWG